MAARVFRLIKSAIANLSTKTAVPLSSATAIDLFAPVTASGFVAGPEGAMRVPAVCGAVTLISESIGCLEPALYREGPDGREEIKDHPAMAVLAQPNGWTSRPEFVAQLVLDSVLVGDGLALVARVAGQPRELHRIDPRSASIDLDLETGAPTYRVTMIDGESRIYGWQDVAHVKQRSIDGLRGKGLIHTAAGAIELAQLLESYAIGLFARGGRPSGILEIAGRCDQSMLDRLRSSFAAIYGGPGNAGRTAILENGAKFTPLQINSVDAQFQEMRAFQIVEISRALSVPTPLLGDMSSATYSNVENLSQEFLDRCLMPQVEKIERALERVLLSPEEKADGYEIEFSVDALVRANLQARYSAWATAIQNGVMTQNEVRTREGLPPMEGADKLLQTVQTLPTTPTPAPKTSKRTP
jgi:HK97 family phage portal protein